MAHVHKEVFLYHSAHQIFSIITDIPSYPLFLNWCYEARVDSSVGNGVVYATLGINFHGIKQSFQTKNTMIEDRSVDLLLVKGPFQRLEGRWLLQPICLPDSLSEGCHVLFNLEYTFSSVFLEKAIDPIFSGIAAGLVDSFVKRADTLYGRSTD